MRNATPSLLALFCLLAVPSVSMGADAKTYPGLACIPTDGTVTAAYGAVWNADTSDTLTVRCPLVRDETTGVSTTSGAVYAVDATDSDEVVCTLYAFKSTDPSGTKYSSKQSTGDSSFSSTPKKLSFSSITTFSGGYVEYNCTIPPEDAGEMSGVVSYYLNE